MDRHAGRLSQYQASDKGRVVGRHEYDRDRVLFGASTPVDIHLMMHKGTRLGSLLLLPLRRCARVARSRMWEPSGVTQSLGPCVRPLAPAMNREG